MTSIGVQISPRAVGRTSRVTYDVSSSPLLPQQDTSTTTSSTAARTTLDDLEDTQVLLDTPLSSYTLDKTSDTPSSYAQELLHTSSSYQRERLDTSSSYPQERLHASSTSTYPRVRYARPDVTDTRGQYRVEGTLDWDESELSSFGYYSRAAPDLGIRDSNGVRTEEEWPIDAPHPYHDPLSPITHFDPLCPVSYNICG